MEGSQLYILTDDSCKRTHFQLLPPQNNQMEYREIKIPASFIYTHIRNALKDVPPGIWWTFIDLPLAARQVQIENFRNS